LQAVATLVVCVDRADDIGRKTGLETPVVGWEAIRSLVTDVGLADPEDSSVNSLLEALRVARDLRDADEESVVAVVSGESESVVGADRAVALQIDELIAAHDLDRAIVVIDSAEDERLVPVIESRLSVDSVDRVVVRQAHDIESTYYLLKQFLADEELRQTVLVPVGLALVAFPALALWASPAVGAAAITAVIGVFLLYKGFSVDELMRDAATQTREALYSGNVSIVTYVVAGGLTLVGVFVGALTVSEMQSVEGVVVPAMRFAFEAVPWLTAAGVTASSGRILDEALTDERTLSSSSINIPFVLTSVALVVRGFSGYFLDRADVFEPVEVSAVSLGALTIDSFTLGTGERLALFVVAAVLLAVVGVRTAAFVTESAVEEEALEDAVEEDAEEFETGS
jgi:putative membrane protein